VPDQEDTWQGNYFNYFTEVEERFQQARGTGLFLLSPLDWALIESWKEAGVPLEAVLRGIDAAFEKWRKKKSRTQMVNSLTYCTQAVMEEARRMAEGGVGSSRHVEAPFPLEALRDFLTSNANHLSSLEGFGEIAAALAQLITEAEQHYAQLEELEQRLTALEEKMLAIARSRLSDEDLFQDRQELERELRPHRGRMTAEQIKMLERQYLDRKLIERAGLRRLSIFYL
jgi:hypothetical protein